jgi:carbamate kinase
MTRAQAQTYIEEGQFAAGSMLPKVRAACEFVSGGLGRIAIIGSLDRAAEALTGTSGTRITF